MRRWFAAAPAVFLALWASSALAVPPAAPAPAALPTVVKTNEQGSVRFDVHARESTVLFRSASQKFNASLDAPKLKLQLKDVADGKQVSTEQLAQLKLVRKDGNVLRSTFVLLDKNHEAPPKLDLLVTKFGKMNDAIAAGDKIQTAHYARSVVKALDTRALKKEIKEFDPATHKSFEKHMDEECKNLESSLQKSSLRAPEFHDMRKSLTKVLTILTLAPDSRKDPAVEKLYQKVFTTQTEMGLIHDDLAARSMRGEIKYETYDVVLPKPMRAQLRDILDSLE